MPSRRFHAKSRNGCFRCKARKVKCDIQKPVCGHCSRRNEECVFPKEPPRRSGSEILGDDYGESEIGATFNEFHLNDWTPPVVARPSDPGQLLLQNFASRVTRIITHNRELQEVWALNLMQDSHRHAHLMHGMLAVSALHHSQTAAVSAAEAEYFRELAVDHHDYSVSLFRPMLTGLNDENFDPFYANSMLILMFNAIFLGSSSNNSPPTLASDIVSLCQLAKGVTVLRAQAGNRSRLYQHYRDRNNSPPPQLPAKINQTIVSIEKIISRLPDCGHGSEKKLVYLRAVALLRCTLEGYFLNIDHPALLFVWVAATDDKYLDLLMLHDPMAMRILAHYGICLLQVPGEWCVNSLGRNILSGLKHTSELKMSWDAQHNQATSSEAVAEKSAMVLPIHHRTELPS